MTTYTTTHRWCVDGHDSAHPDAAYAGDGTFPPFVIFDIAEQDNLPGLYQTRQEAEEALVKLKQAKLQEALANCLTGEERTLLVDALISRKSIPACTVREVDRWEVEGWPGATLARKDELLRDRARNSATVAAVDALIAKVG